MRILRTTLVPVGFQDRLSLNAGQKYCRMLRWEHFAILSTFITLPLVIKTFILSILEWPFYTTVFSSIFTLTEPSDAELENFQRAVKQKRAAADSKTIMKCVAPQVNSKNRKSEAQEAEEIALCILAEATKKEQEKRDSAADMVRRYFCTPSLVSRLRETTFG